MLDIILINERIQIYQRVLMNSIALQTFTFDYGGGTILNSPTHNIITLYEFLLNCIRVYAR